MVEIILKILVLLDIGWVRDCEKMVIEAHLGMYSVLRRDKMQRAADNAPIGCSASARFGVVCAVEFDNLARLGFYHLVTGNIVGML